MHRLHTVNVDSSLALGNVQADLNFQFEILRGVSRTFALTIPVLSDALADVVANAYLLCRLADTIEDDTNLDDASKSAFCNRFVAVVRGDAAAESFANDLAPRLSERTLVAERELIRKAARVIRVTHSFSEHDREVILRCVSRMCAGMPKFQRHRSLDGLADLDEMSAYCYVVAGVVGEMLTELFCAHCPNLIRTRQELMQLAPSFGQGLQMTNILKDVWEDRRSGTCWLPRCVFGNGFDLGRLEELYVTASYRHGIEQLVGVAHRHLRNAVDYALRIPASEAGLRRFCLWPVGLAVLTLRKVQRYCDFQRGSPMKISRRSVRATLFGTNLVYRSNRAVRALFDILGAGMPLAARVPVGTATSGLGQPDASRA